MLAARRALCWAALLQGKLVGRVFEWLLPQPVDDCLRVLASCLLGGPEVTPLMCSTTETVGSASGDGEEDTVRRMRMHAWHCSSAAQTACGPPACSTASLAGGVAWPVLGGLGHMLGSESDLRRLHRTWWRPC